MPRTLLRFVTVRNPRKPTSKELETGFLRYDADLDSPVVAAMAELRKRDLKPGAIAELAEEIRKRIGEVDDETFAADHPELSAWVEFLAASSATLTWKDFAAFKDHRQIDVDDETRRILWDHLILTTYGGGDPEVRETLMWALRAINLYMQEPTGDDADARRLANATVLLPTDVHGPVNPRPTRQPGDQGAPKGKKPEDPRAKLERLEKARGELEVLYHRAKETARLAEVPPPQVPQIGADGCLEPPEAPATAEQRFAVLDDDTLARISDESRATIERFVDGDTPRLAYLMERLDEEAIEIGKREYRSAKASRSVAQVGGALWMQAPPAQAAVTPADEKLWRVMDRGDFEYKGFDGPKWHPKDRDDCTVRPLGIADFRRVEQEICCYEPGEVAHIENVMQGETKRRTTRRLIRTEDIFTVSEEEELTEERDSQTTDRFELERETSKIVEEDMKFELGVNVVAEYGPVKITADTKFATSSSTKESDKLASKYAQEVTERAKERVVSKVREERTTKTINEYEETNLHELKGGDDAHVVGLYRWVDKVYEAKVVNYGKRLMFEFLVPEPAAFHLDTMVKEPVESTLRVEKPVDPRTDETWEVFGRAPLTSHTSLSPYNYPFWASAYDVEVEPPPPQTVVTSKAYHREGMDHSVQFADSKNDLTLPDGYEAVWFSAKFGLHSQNHDGGPNWVTVMVGRQSHFATSGGSFSGWLDSEDDIVPISIMGRTRFYATNIEVECSRTPAHYAEWQIETFDKILTAYENKLTAYETALAAAKVKLGIEIQGTNPLLNRDIEMTELKKGAIRLLTKCGHLPSDAMRDDGECGYPEFDCCEAIRDGSVVQFFEQLFEWRLMTYLFYPYFWGRKCNWQTIYTLDDVDTLFLRFLKAGYARVLVPVREGYERAAMRYLADGAIWNGGDAPGVESPMYVAIENELKEPVGEVDPEVTPWQITVPTTLTVLQCESGCVEGSGLPCPCEDRDEDGGG